jgi:hypothetical protein
LTDGERRKNLRLDLAVPVRVQGYLADGSTWEEFSTTENVSAGGASFPLTHGVELGQILFLSLALPRRLRQFDLTDATYRVYTLVRGVRHRAGQPLVGVMFFGKYPPRGFKDRPAARYLLPSDSTAGSPVPAELQEGPSPPGNRDSASPEGRAAGRPEVPAPSAEPSSAAEPSPASPSPAGSSAPAQAGKGDERRRHPRMNIFLNFTLQQVDEWGAVLQEELTVADNVSRGGARVMTTLPFRVGDVILLQEAGGGFATRAEVRAITQSQPSIERLHLRFLDREAPDRLLRQ